MSVDVVLLIERCLHIDRNQAHTRYSLMLTTTQDRWKQAAAALGPADLTAPPPLDTAAPLLPSPVADWLTAGKVASLPEAAVELIVRNSRGRLFDKARDLRNARILLKITENELIERTRAELRASNDREDQA